MLIPLQEILSKYNLKPKGVIHVGAHWAEEHSGYLKCGIERFVYIEPCKDAFNKMSTSFLINGTHGEKGVIRDGVSLYNVACGSEEKEDVMYVSHQNQGQSNSLKKPIKHTEYHPEIIFDDAELVKVVPLDSLPINKENYQLLVCDVQGFEGEVFRGGVETIKNMDAIYTEINRDFTYENNMLIDDMDNFLGNLGFIRVETHWPSPSWGWGDGFFIKK